MTEFHNLSDEEAENAVNLVKSYLPDEARLNALCFTGGRAFGWGSKNTDIDLRGMFYMEDWFHSCHVGYEKNYHIDGTIENIYNVPDKYLYDHSFSDFYDQSKVLYEHEDWDHDDFLSHATAEEVAFGYPYNVDLQVERMKKDFQVRSVCHTYKEIMIPLHFLRTGEIESNVVKLSREGPFDIDGLEQAAEIYLETDRCTDHGIEKDDIYPEVYRLFDELGYELEEQTDYEHDPYYE